MWCHQKNIITVIIMLLLHVYATRSNLSHSNLFQSNLFQSVSFSRACCLTREQCWIVPRPLLHRLCGAHGQLPGNFAERVRSPPVFSPSHRPCNIFAAMALPKWRPSLPSWAMDPLGVGLLGKHASLAAYWWPSWQQPWNIPDHLRPHEHHLLIQRPTLGPPLHGNRCYPKIQGLLHLEPYVRVGDEDPVLPREEHQWEMCRYQRLPHMSHHYKRETPGRKWAMMGGTKWDKNNPWGMAKHISNHIGQTGHQNQSAISMGALVESDFTTWKNWSLCW